MVMIVATVLIVLVGGMVVWVFDGNEFPDYGSALWYTLQTVTTVGYGDKVPTEGVGRVVGAVVMIVAVALIAIITASITSTFVEASQRRHQKSQQADTQDSFEIVDERLTEIAARLASIERTLSDLEPRRGPRPAPDAPASRGGTEP